MLEALYVIIGLTLIIGWLAATVGFGVRRAVWACLILLPFRIVLPPEVGRVAGFENQMLVPDVLIPLTFVVWLLQRSADAPRVSMTRMFPPAALAVAAALILSFQPGVDVRDFLSELQKWTVYGLAFVLVSQTMRTRRDIEITVAVILIAGVLVTLRDVPAYFSLFNLPAPLGYSPNRDAKLWAAGDFTRYQGTGWPVFINTLFLFIFARLAVLGRAISRLQRSLLFVYGGLMAALLALSFYRGDWVALVIGIAAVIVFPGMRSFRAARTVALLAVSGALVLGFLAGARFREALQARAATLMQPVVEEHVVIRVDAAAEAWQMFREHPLRGVGAGQYGRHFETYARAQIYGQAIDPSYFQQANNDYFQYLATTGLIGFSAIAWLFLGFLVWARRLYLAPGTPLRLRAALLGCFLAIVGVLGDALTEDPMWDKHHGVLVFTLFGIIWAVGSLWAREAPAVPAAAEPLAAGHAP